MKTVNAAGLALIKSFEGLRLESYDDGVGVWTIGYGHTKGVEPGQKITEEQAEMFLLDDLLAATIGVKNGVAGVPTTDNQFAAMVSLAFNIGVAGFNKSSVLRLHRAGDHAGAAASFAMWNKAGGQIMKGLTRRRAAEAALYATQES